MKGQIRKSVVGKDCVSVNVQGSSLGELRSGDEEPRLAF